MIKDLLVEAVGRKASDIHITAGVPPVYRINGQLVRTNRPVLSQYDTAAMMEEIVSADQRERFLANGELDFSFAIPGVSRFRANVFRQRGAMGLALRVINEHIATLDELGHPEILKTLARLSKGLVLVTGPTGSGKSTTLAAMLDLINSERACHILTLEDPIEYLHKHKNSIVNQREIHSDTRSFAAALRAALREDPDVILVGEMRDAETIGIAVTAAETGHLVFATLHTGDASQTVDRIIDVFPTHQQQQIRVQLSLTLQGIISQQLILRLDGAGRAAALEILTATQALRNLIREGKSHQILSVIQTGARNGMQSMDIALKNLYNTGKISYDEALVRASNPDAFAKLVQH
ncbi:type IV pilus twitching motility protein PilT|uniref:Twitching motility protein PilT n=1 Tax=Dendrosporobacter quercicolus TaxID=146817 RepID=A0A1G9M8U8_9FIRM|nr:type IV pilus twitching motility protein PilT [Dendrosporobacter quercicolus]NSL46955.1 type IV pilus twitching motility protein PilT [Dendrosporobacter quercicolus DSM 1736]SDL70401.1 twitching motility protein PilT [Dendrosporobacter quercicolus]